MGWRVPLFDLDYGKEEKNAVLRVLNSGWVTMGSVTQTFEEKFASQFEIKHAVAVTNATAALHLACLALDIGPGDEVIVPSLTFVATANAVLYTGAKVRFADILGADEPNISPQAIKRQITAQTKAIIVMHYGGYPCQMEAIMDIANQHGLAIIEDAAHAPGGTLNERPLGTWGDVGCFSFFSNKNISTGEGGMVVTNRDELADKIRILRSHGMTSLTWDRHKGHAHTYDVVNLGHNYRIDEIRSALGLVQLQKLVTNNAKRQSITEQYRTALTGLVEIPFCSVAGRSACHLLPIVLPPNVERKQFIDSMRKAGIQTSIHYPPIHEFTYYRQLYPDLCLPTTETFGRKEVTLPLYPAMSQESIIAVISEVRAALK